MPLKLIEIIQLQLQVFYHRTMGAQQAHDDTQQYDGTEKNEHARIVPEDLHFRSGRFYQNDCDIEEKNGNTGRYQPVDNSPDIQRLCNEPSRSAHHLHRLYQETVGIHGQPDRIVYRKDHEYGKQYGRNQKPDHEIFCKAAYFSYDLLREFEFRHEPGVIILY